MSQRLQPIKGHGWLWILGIVMILLAVGVVSAKLDKKQISSSPARAAEKVEARPVIIWSKWKEVILVEEWSEYIDTPTNKDRISPPPGGRVEVLYENGTYHELKNTSSDEKYEVIDIQMDGRFKLKGSPGTKATIWIGKQG